MYYPPPPLFPTDLDLNLLQCNSYNLVHIECQHYSIWTFFSLIFLFKQCCTKINSILILFVMNYYCARSTDKVNPFSLSLSKKKSAEQSLRNLYNKLSHLNIE